MNRRTFFGIAGTYATGFFQNINPQTQNSSLEERLKTEIRQLEEQIIKSYLPREESYPSVQVLQKWEIGSVFNLTAEILVTRYGGYRHFHLMLYAKNGVYDQYPFTSASLKDDNPERLDGWAVINRRKNNIQDSPDIVLTRIRGAMQAMIDAYNTAPDKEKLVKNAKVFSRPDGGIYIER